MPPSTDDQRLLTPHKLHHTSDSLHGNKLIACYSTGALQSARARHIANAFVRFSIRCRSILQATQKVSAARRTAHERQDGMIMT